jgi:hypothetical protein
MGLTVSRSHCVTESRLSEAGGPLDAVFLHDHGRNAVVTPGASMRAGSMDEKAIKRAALLTLRRALRERFPPGVERTRWLRWAARAAKSLTPAQLVPLPTGRASSFERVYRDAIFLEGVICGLFHFRAPAQRLGGLLMSTVHRPQAPARSSSSLRGSRNGLTTASRIDELLPHRWQPQPGTH